MKTADVAVGPWLTYVCSRTHHASVANNIATFNPAKLSIFREI